MAKQSENYLDLTTKDNALKINKKNDNIEEYHIDNLPKRAYKMLYSKSMMRNANEYMPQSNEGWYMLETGKDEGINNIILYIDDIYDNPTISSAIFINLNN